MPEQLSLELPGGAAAIPATLRPMLPRPAAAFASDDHLFSPLWGGRRALAFLEDDRSPTVRLVDRRGRDLAGRLPELLPALLAGLGQDSLPAILDGEIVVPAPSGHADGHALAARLDAAVPPAGPAAVYLAFDLLYLGGRSLLAVPLDRRQALLARAVRPGGDLVLVPTVAAAGLDLYAAVVVQGLPALLGRHARSPYLPGRRSGLWRRVSAGAPTPVVPIAETEPGPSSRPVLALIQRLPLDWS